VGVLIFQRPTSAAFVRLRYYASGDGSCTSCPNVSSAWDRYRVLFTGHTRRCRCCVFKWESCLGLLLSPLEGHSGAPRDGSWT